VTRLEDRDRPAALGNLPRDREASEPGADHTHINVQIEVQAWPLGASNRGRLVPARFHVVAFAHGLRYAMQSWRSTRERMLDRGRTNVEIHSMTMRRLLLFRHAKTERSEPGMEDRSRKLVERGRKDAASIGAYMATHALIPDRVMTSPAARTQETWKLAAAAFKPTPAGSAVERLYGATPHEIFDLIKQAPANAHTLLIVGHNPGLHELAQMLVASGDIETREQMREKLPTSGLLIIDFAFDEWAKLHPQSGRLERFITPKSLDARPN